MTFYLLDDRSNGLSMTRTETRTQLINVGSEVIGLHGFNTTGINSVLQVAGVPKGSFYYYFSSKEDFGLAVIDATASNYSEQIEQFLSDTSLSPLNRIRTYMQSGLERIEQGRCKHGCLIGTLGQELSAHNETFRARLDEIFEGWKQRFSVCLEEARVLGELPADSNCDELAEFLLAGWQGAILRAKMNSSTAPLKAFIETVFGRFLKAA